MYFLLESKISGFTVDYKLTIVIV